MSAAACDRGRLRWATSNTSSDRPSAAEHFPGLHREATACLAIQNVANDVGRTTHGTLRLRHAHGILQMTGPSRHRRSLPPRRPDTPMTGSDDPAAGGSASCLRCPRCGLRLRPRASWLTIEHCPRCIARDRTPVKLLCSPAPTIEQCGQGFGPNARGATTDQAPFAEDKKAAS
jgi:hypothetical protein